MTKNTFRFERVAYRYGRDEWIFRNIDFSVDIGESIVLLGANGSGKSTLLKMMCGLNFPSAGRFLAFDQEITEDNLENDLAAKEYHRRVGFVFQNSDAQLFTTSVWDEIAFGPLQIGLKRDEVRTRVGDVMEMFGISNLADRSPYRLSGGEKKKVALASVLVLDPEVLILDEPTNGLDPKTQRWLTDFLLELNHQGRTIVVATHNLELAHAIADRALVLSEDHRLIFDGPTREALSNRELLLEVNLIDEYFHMHEGERHIHRYSHN
ncbi:MAG: energy-coupling factor ABC transporter ATP-binding protein [Deltaproteobacteria bacterium]